MAKSIIFYSWQSDLPGNTNRYFIEKVLESAATQIANDGSIEIEPVVDRDTKGLSGSPEISSSILAKINAADAFVADISIIGIAGDRPTPNPNVLIELGYAISKLSHERVFLVFNEAYGQIADVPFDLRTRRIYKYKFDSTKADQKKTAKAELGAQMDTAIRGLPPSPATISTSPSIDAIENGKPNKPVLLRADLKQIEQKLNDLEPKIHSQGGTVEELISAIEKTQEPISDFSKIIEAIAVINDGDSAMEVYKWFGKIIEKYHLPPTHEGRTSNGDCDYFKFVGQELFVTFFAFLLKEKRLEIIQNLLNEPIRVSHWYHTNGPQNVFWDSVSEHLPVLLDESRTRKRTSLHADLLHERHTTGGLSAIMPFEDFSAADYFLFLKSQLGSSDQVQYWQAWSSLYIKDAPMFIHDAVKKEYAYKLAIALGVSGVDKLKEGISERAPNVKKLFNDRLGEIVRQEDIDNIGKR